MERNESVVIGLEVEFRKALEGVETLTAFTRELGKLLGLMGFSDFSVLSWNPVGRYHRNPPTTLIKNSSQQTLNQAVDYLADTVVAQPDKGILQACFEEIESLVDPAESSVRCSSYRLTTRSGNYGYFIRKGSQSRGFLQVLCVVDSSKDPDQFTKKIEQHQMALYSINKVIEEIGLEQFPEHFSAIESEDKVSVGSKPLRLLNIIALDNVTVSQAAEMLDISVDTANKYIAKIKLELGVSTLPSAVFYASNKGLIDRVL